VKVIHVLKNEEDFLQLVVIRKNQVRGREKFPKPSAADSGGSILKGP